MQIDPQTVLHAAAGGIWVPPEAERIDADGYVMVRYDNEFLYDTCVYAVDTDRGAEALITEANDRALAWGRSTVWWNGLSEATRPADLEPLLQQRGAELVEELSVLALDLTAPLPDLEVPADVEAVRPTEVRHLQDKHAIHDEVFGSRTGATLSYAQRLAREVETRAAGKGDSVVVYVEGAPASFGGATYDHGVARLWGGSTLPQVRGRGAYRAALDARLQAARDAGCTMALVKGRIATSAPTLRRAGFRAYGVERVYSCSTTPSSSR